MKATDRIIPLVPGLEAILEQAAIDLIICDLWGVLHDGRTLHQAAVDALLYARSRGVCTVFLSNAPWSRSRTVRALLRMGLPAALADQVFTSGALTRERVRQQHQGQRLYHLGPLLGDNGLLDGLDTIPVARPEQADVILVTDREVADLAPYRHWLRPAAEKDIPLICANPDRYVQVGEKMIICAGALADLYKELGGPVVFYGKPEAASYLACLDAAGLARDHQRIVAIGDSAATDIIGANRMGFQSVLITGGLHRDAFAAVWKGRPGALAAAGLGSILAPYDARPTWLMERLTRA